MTSFSKTLMCACFALLANASFAQDTMKKDEPMAKDGMMKKEMTMQDCKDHMAMKKDNMKKDDAMMKKDGMKKDDAMMKKEAMCADMMKKDSMKKDEPMKK